MILNLINKIPDDEAEYLYPHEKTDVNSDAGDSESKSDDKYDIGEVIDNELPASHEGESVELPEPHIEHRRLVLFVSHSRDLISFGFIDENLVWFSLTKTDDLLLTRRIFDCMKVGKFYRKVTPDKALMSTGVAQIDLCGMCRIDITHLESDRPVFTGWLENASGKDKKGIVTSVEFANKIAVLPERIRANIADIGSADDILTELEKDYKTLETLYDNDDTAQEKRDKALVIRSKWYDAKCLNMSDRATIRTLYRDVCYHKCAVDLPSIVDMLAAM